MSAQTVEVDIGKLKAAFAMFPKELKTQMYDAFDHTGRRFLKKLKDERLKGPPGIRGTFGPGSLFWRFKRVDLIAKDLDGWGISIFTDSKIARLQEEGGTVVSPSGKKLAVPLSARTEMFTSAGKLRQAYKHPGQMKGLIPIIIKGQTYLAKVFKGFKHPVPLYILKSKVKIPGRLGFYQTWEDMSNDRIFLINEAVDKALKKTF